MSLWNDRRKVQLALDDCAREMAIMCDYTIAARGDPLEAVDEGMRSFDEPFPLR